MHFPECNDGKHDHENLLAEFNATKIDDLKKIEEFIQILNDWIEETAPEIENEPVEAPKTGGKKKIIIPEDKPAETNYAFYGAVAAVALAAGYVAFKQLNKN